MKINLFHYLTLLLLVPGLFSSQSSEKFLKAELKITTQPAKKAVHVEVNIPSGEDFLVIVTNEKGFTVFLENQYRFKGVYKKEIELPAKGNYELQLIRNSDKITRRLEIK